MLTVVTEPLVLSLARLVPSEVEVASCPERSRTQERPVGKGAEGRSRSMPLAQPLVEKCGKLRILIT